MTALAVIPNASGIPQLPALIAEAGERASWWSARRFLYQLRCDKLEQEE